MRFLNVATTFLAAGATLSAATAIDIEKRGIVDDVWEAIKDAATCDACQVSTNIFRLF